MKHAKTEMEVLDRESAALRRKLTKSTSRMWKRKDSRNHLVTWIRKHPFAALGAGFAGGAVAGRLARSSGSRRALRPLIRFMMQFAQGTGLSMLLQRFTPTEETTETAVSEDAASALEGGQVSVGDG